MSSDVKRLFGSRLRAEKSRPAGLSITDLSAVGHSQGMGASRIPPASAAAAGGPCGLEAPAKAELMHNQAAAELSRDPETALLRARTSGAVETELEASPAQWTLQGVYEAYFDFVWRSARRLGVQATQLDDVVQEVFLVVHRRLSDFEGRSTLKSWLFGITRRVVRDQRRSARRHPTEPLGIHDPADLAGRPADEQLLLVERAELLHTILGKLDDDKREVFVLAEVEQMSGPEIAAALQINLNTVYARVRAARKAFEESLLRLIAREPERMA